jgi:hypothetical protein
MKAVSVRPPSVSSLFLVAIAVGSPYFKIKPARTDSAETISRPNLLGWLSIGCSRWGGKLSYRYVTRSGRFYVKPRYLEVVNLFIVFKHASRLQ